MKLLIRYRQLLVYSFSHYPMLPVLEFLDLEYQIAIIVSRVLLHQSLSIIFSFQSRRCMLCFLQQYCYGKQSSLSYLQLAQLY
ncbi:hypothetical protein FGO68_gene447 [Halteria grandinella]|uniref:Uncharacterized protein n=1 Tax=Halteria grandinella TaxID=5974 RepID=A0A8J8NFL3_HALGN|nr:hypothetical protein FGO68_gene447 [Halteria grandinella]